MVRHRRYRSACVAVATLSAAVCAASAQLLPVADADAAAFAPGSSDAWTLLKRMPASWARIEDYVAIQSMRELWPRGLSSPMKLLVKFRRPLSVYLKFLTKFVGREALYVRGRNKNRVKVRLVRFPYLTVNVKPGGRAIMAGGHHPVTHFGWDYILRRLRSDVDLARSRGEDKLWIDGRCETIGGPGTRLRIELPVDAGFSHTVARGETYWTLAPRYDKDFGVLRIVNGELHPGKKIFIPLYYTPSLWLCVDDALGIPLAWDIKAHDGRIYESVRFEELRVNVGLSDADFDPDNPDYRF